MTSTIYVELDLLYLELLKNGSTAIILRDQQSNTSRATLDLRDDIFMPTQNRMEALLTCIQNAQEKFAQSLASYLKHRDTTLEQYLRYLSFQYHLTKDVQRYFLAIAAHPDLSRRRKLREFLFQFANEEELHYLVAANDLHKLGHQPLPMPFDVELWHVYFRQIVHERPFVRLGAAAILENISDGVAKPWVKKALRGDFLTRDNTKFFVLHQHESLPHGDQLLRIIADSDLASSHFDDLVEGARKGAILYLRMVEWAICLEPSVVNADGTSLNLTEKETDRIRKFDMKELDGELA